MYIIFDQFGTMVLLVTPNAVELSVWIGLCGCGHPMLIRVCRWETISWAAIKRVASSASAAKAMTNLIMVAIVRTKLLKHGNGSSSKRKICAPALLQDQVSLRYPASAWAQSTMSLTL
jgi:hypothetical protein